MICNSFCITRLRISELLFSAINGCTEACGEISEGEHTQVTSIVRVGTRRHSPLGCPRLVVLLCRLDLRHLQTFVDRVRPFSRHMPDSESMETDSADVSCARNMDAGKSSKIDDECLMWIEKYRPRSLDDMLSHAAIIDTLRRLISNNRLPHLLFYGPPGTGKTSTILACAKEMYGNDFRSMVLELNASDDRGIDVVRDQIKSFASTRRIFSSGVKLIILDEADAMTNAAQMALRRIVEKYTANTRFCLICNFANKIMPALQSRCTKFRFGPVPPEDVRARVAEIAKLENVKFAQGALDALLILSQGDMRRVLNILQSTHMAVSPAAISFDALYANTGEPHPADIQSVFNTLTKSDVDFVECADQLGSLRAEKGVSLSDLVTGLFNCVTAANCSQLSDNAKIYLYQQLADVEHRLALGASETVNLAALIGAFVFAVSITEEKRKQP